MIRQGDVLIIPTTLRMIDGVKHTRDNGRLVLAYGEATGHAHAIEKGNCDLITSTLAELFLLVYGDEVTLEHPEHSALTISPGSYRVVRQREYTPETPVWVAD